MVRVEEPGSSVKGLYQESEHESTGCVSTPCPQVMSHAGSGDMLLVQDIWRS